MLTAEDLDHMNEVKVNDVANRPPGRQGFRIGNLLGVLFDEVREFVETCCSLLASELGPGTMPEGFLGLGNCEVNVFRSSNL